VNVFQFYSLGHSIHPLSEVKAGSKLKECYYEIFTAKIWLDYMLDDQMLPLGVAKPACQSLLGALRAILGPDDAAKDMEKEISQYEAFSVTNGVTTVETVLSAQLQSHSTYFVSRKLGYETSLLIEEGEKLLPEAVRKAMPEVVPDLQQAAKCIAFDIPTAAGFHIIRATEAAIRKYYESVVGKPPKTKMRNWGTYIKYLKKAKAPEGVTGFLDHIRETYRNPVLHPEATLKPDEAHVLLGVCVSAIILMFDSTKVKPVALQAAAGPVSLAD
jgi:hypothetical protein